MKCVIGTHDKNNGLPQERKFTEDRFLEQFAALEEGLALVQVQMRELSENARLFSELVRHMRRSICPTTLSSKENA